MNRLTACLMLPFTLCLILGCSGRGERMRSQLAELEQANRADSVMRNDSLAETLVDYFDHHGTPNERMRARYILGRTYADLGELPRALETYFTAADCADTTASDCDYNVLSRIHGQKAELFLSQSMPHEALRESDAAAIYEKMAGDTLNALVCYMNKVRSFNQLGKYDSVIVVADSAYRKFKEMGMTEMEQDVLPGLINTLLHIKQVERAKYYMDQYFASSQGRIVLNPILTSPILIWASIIYMKGGATQP